jgi:DNA-binding SARP family transcriptional activator
MTECPRPFPLVAQMAEHATGRTPAALRSAPGSGCPNGGHAPAAGDRSARVELLGPFRVTTANAEPKLPVRSQRLIALLAVHDRPLPRTFVAGTLWPDVTEERAAANLRESLWRLRSGPDPLVESEARCLALRPGVSVDFREMMDQATRLLAGRMGPGEEICVDALMQDLLPGWGDEWVVLERERARQLRLHALEVACLRLIELGRHAQAVMAGVRAVAADPMRESAQRVLIRAHLAEGNAGEAAVQYWRYRKLLHDELGILPSPQLEDLVRGINTSRMAVRAYAR